MVASVVVASVVVASVVVASVVVASVVVASVVVAAVVVSTMPVAGPVTAVASDGVVGEGSPRGRDEERTGKTGGTEHALEHCVPF